MFDNTRRQQEQTKLLPLGQCTESGVVGNLSTTLPSEPRQQGFHNPVSFGRTLGFQKKGLVGFSPNRQPSNNMQQTHWAIWSIIQGFLEKICILQLSLTLLGVKFGCPPTAAIGSRNNANFLGRPRSSPDAAAFDSMSANTSRPYELPGVSLCIM